MLVLPNSGKTKISSHYTSPLKLFEYLAAGKPIVASDLPSIRDILNKDTAMLVVSDDAQALAQGITVVLTDDALAKKLASNASELAKQYSWEQRAKKISDFIFAR